MRKGPPRAWRRVTAVGDRAEWTLGTQGTSTISRWRFAYEVSELSVQAERKARSCHAPQGIRGRRFSNGTVVGLVMMQRRH